MTFIGVDPHWAKPYAVTILVDGVITKQVLCEITYLHSLIQECYRADPETVVAVEDQYMNKNYNTAKKLSWSAGKVMGVAELVGAVCTPVNVASWKAKMKAQKGLHVEVSVLLGGTAHDDLASSHLIAEFVRTTWSKL